MLLTCCLGHHKHQATYHYASDGATTESHDLSGHKVTPPVPNGQTLLQPDCAARQTKTSRIGAQGPATTRSALPRRWKRPSTFQLRLSHGIKTCKSAQHIADAPQRFTHEIKHARSIQGHRISIKTAPG